MLSWRFETVICSRGWTSKWFEKLKKWNSPIVDKVSKDEWIQKNINDCILDPEDIECNIPTGLKSNLTIVRNHMLDILSYMINQSLFSVIPLWLQQRLRHDWFQNSTETGQSKHRRMVSCRWCAGRSKLHISRIGIHSANVLQECLWHLFLWTPWFVYFLVHFLITNKMFYSRTTPA